MSSIKLIIQNSKVVLKTVANYILNVTGIRDLNTGTSDVTNGKIDWTLQHLTDTAANFTSTNPILLVGQIGIESDDLLTSPKFKIGDGVTAWDDLPYASGSGALTLQQVLTNGNATNIDLTSLDGDGILRFGTNNILVQRSGSGGATSSSMSLGNASSSFEAQGTTNYGAYSLDNTRATVYHDAEIDHVAPSVKANGSEVITVASKDATGGYAGLTLFKINFKNVLNTFTSFFTNSNTASRTYTFQDRNGTIADDTDLALKSPIASPTFTGTVTTPAIVVSSETASRVAIIDASKNVKSANTATYPSLTELSYVKGVTSAIQTQINAKGVGTIKGAIAATSGLIPVGNGTADTVTTHATFTFDNANTRLKVGSVAQTSVFNRNFVVSNSGASSIALYSSDTAVSQTMVFGQSNTNFSVFQKNGSTLAGNWTGSSVPFANSVGFYNGASQDLPVIIAGSVTYNMSGISSTNAATQLNSIGFRIGKLSDIHTANTEAFEIYDGGNTKLGTTTGTKWGTATSQKQGWYNATPVVQQTTSVAAATFVQNTGNTIHETSTFDGYTIKQVVAALRLYGFLA